MIIPSLHRHWLLLLLLSWVPAAWAQSPVTVTPALFTDTTPITLTFDATLGSGGLANYTGDVYIYTGVITNLSTSNSDWKHVLNPNANGYSNPIPAEKMTALGNHRYSISFTPRTFYPGLATSTEVVQKLAMVFRGVTGSPEGKGPGNADILVNVSQSSALQAAITNPASTNGNPTIVASGTSLSVSGVASAPATLTLTLNGTQVAQQTNANTLTANVTINQPGVNTLVLTATAGSSTATATTTVLVAPTPATAALPAGAKADGITYLNNGTSAILSLTAPNKSYVYVLGDFSNWQVANAGLLNRTSTVNSDPATGRWWVQVDGLTPGQEYAYQFLVDGQLRVADPYCEKILTPTDDNFINAGGYTVYPNLKPYPTGSTTGNVSVLSPGAAGYTWTVTGFQRPARANLVVYELHLRDFIARHDYATLTDTLAYLQRLGVNAIELMPVSEFEGNDSWGYNPSFYFAPDKYYGTKNAFKRFIDACHSKGIAVIMDMVLNQSFGQSPMVQMYFDNGANKPASTNPWFNPDATHPFNVGYDFNHESGYTRYFSKRVMEFWLQEYHIDGYRFDLSKGFTQVNSGTNVALWGNYDQSRINIWQDYYSTLMATDATMYPILEHFAVNTEETVLANMGFMIWGNLNPGYTQAAMGYSTSPSWDLSAGYAGTGQGGRGWNQLNLVTYMESHDEERLQYKNKTFGNRNGSYDVQNVAIGLQRDEMAAALFFTQPGPRMVWQFGELGYDYSINTCADGVTIDVNCRTGVKPIRWDYYRDANRRHLYETYRALIALKKGQSVFSSPTSFTQNLTGAVKTINIANASLAVVAFGNFDVVAATTTISFPSTGTWYNYLTGATLNVTSTSMSMNLQPGQYAVYTSSRVALPTSTPLASRAASSAVFKLALAPNPATGTTHVTYELPTAATVTIVVKNLLGQTLHQMVPARQGAGSQTQALAVQGLTPGVYLVQLQAGTQTQTARLLVK